MGERHRGERESSVSFWKITIDSTIIIIIIIIEREREREREETRSHRFEVDAGHTHSTPREEAAVT